jgi:hypothetical protein
MRRLHIGYTVQCTIRLSVVCRLHWRNNHTEDELEKALSVDYCNPLCAVPYSTLDTVPALEPECRPVAPCPENRV